MTTTVLNLLDQVVSKIDQTLGRILRTKVLEKIEVRRKSVTSNPILLPSVAISTKIVTITDFKTESIAEQFTLLDSELFAKIEVAEALLWSKEQKEELTPNLNKFFLHFNNMSYWIRTRILLEEDPKERKKFVSKFIKVMKHLRKLNNFNSVFAILSAIDSAPIRRLDWPKNLMDGLKEFAPLIDSSSSFRAYRQVLAETEPPCIPYMLVIIQ